MFDTLEIDEHTDLSDRLAFMQANEIYVHHHYKDIDKVLRDIGPLPHLELLYIVCSGTPITAAALTAYPNLATLSMYFSSVYPSPDYISVFKEVVEKLPALKKLDFNPDDEDQQIIVTPALMKVFDRLDELNIISEKWVHACWQAIAVTKHVYLEGWDNERLDRFRESVAGLDLTDLDRQILFAMEYQLMAELNRWLPNLIMPLREVKLIKTQHIDRRMSQVDLNITFTKDLREKDVIGIIGARTGFDQVLQFLVNKIPVVTLDHLSEKMMIRTSAYTTTQELSILQQLIAADYEHALPAYNVHTSKAVHSALAAIMRTHPERKVRNWARQHFTNMAPKAFFSHVRKYGNYLMNHFVVEDEKLQEIATHPDIDREIFMLMALTISQRRFPQEQPFFQLKDTQCNDLHPGVALFTNFKVWVFINTKVDLANVSKQLTHLTELRLEKCSYDQQLPAEIGTLTSLETLEIYFRPKESSERERETPILFPAAIGNLTALKKLIISCTAQLPADVLGALVNLEELRLIDVRSDHWEGLQYLDNLQELILRNNAIKGFPGGIFNLRKLVTLAISDSDFSDMEDRFERGSALKQLGLQNNKIQQFPYSAGNLSLDYLSLDNNEITHIDAALFPEGEIRWGILQLSANRLTRIQFPTGRMHIQQLYIGHNQLTTLDASLFTPTLRLLLANYNKISQLPEAILIPSFDKFYAVNNALTDLPAFFKRLKGGFFQLDNNRIAVVHPDVYNREGGTLSLGGNPLPKEVKERFQNRI